MVEPCVDSGPFPCAEDGCPRAVLSCYFLAKHLDACTNSFSDLWQAAPPGFEALFSRGRTIGDACAASCGTCSEERLRATVSPEPGRWPGVTLDVDRIAGSDGSAVQARLQRASTLGPFVITDAMGAHFRPEAWTRAAVHARCSQPAGAPPPAPPWPTISYRQPAATGVKWASLHFDNGARLGVLDLPSLIDAQDSGRLAGVMLFDSPANHTCPALLRRSAALSEANAMPAPRFFPRDFDVALGGRHADGLWGKAKSSRPFDDPDIFVSKRGTRTHVHIDGHCTRFWMLQLHGRKLWRVLPPEEGVHLAGVPNEKRTDTHFLADVLTPADERNDEHNASLRAVGRVFEFELQPGELAMIPEGWPHAVHNLDDTIAMTYNFVDEANLGCYLASLRAHAGRLLQKLFSQLAEGRGAVDAVRTFARHPPLAYYAHLSIVAETAREVSVLDEHLPWGDFLSRQGPYANGGAAALEAEAERLQAALLGLVEARPSREAAAEEAADSLLELFDRFNRTPPPAPPMTRHDEL